MNVVHIAPRAPYNEGWGYQDNLLPKYQAKAGHQVTLIITNTTHKDGKVVETACEDYQSRDGFRVIRRPVVSLPIPKVGWLWNRLEVMDLLRELKPDLIFVHSLISYTIFQIAAYKKKVNPRVVIVMDNHMDYNIGYDPRQNQKDWLICSVYRGFYRRNRRWIKKVYGVTPWRQRYAQEVFGVEPEKTDLLVMGADDEQLDLAHRQEIRARIRQEYGIEDDAFLLVSGGKLDRRKKTLELVQAVRGLPGVRLLLFGQIMPEGQEEITELIASAPNISDIGWIPAERVYDYFFAADLAVFPGQHSVLWEQACAAKVPCIFERWEGMEHVNACGNADFFSPADTQTIRRSIAELIHTERYQLMKRAAESPGTDVFLYSRIAEKALECAETE